jgi:hypothetical protein
VEDIDIDELTVEELIMLLDRSLDPDLPVPVLMKAGQRLAELDPRVMPARPAPRDITALPDARRRPELQLHAGPRPEPVS